MLLTDSLRVQGIALFTLHKYHKSLDTTVPLDAHGNLVSVEEDMHDTPGGHLGYHELDETAHLTACASDDYDQVCSRNC